MPEIENVMPPQNPIPNPNPLFGKYEVGKLLGCGAFAKVYHARDLRSGQSVAIKVINKKRISASSNLVSNIKREISIMRKLNHPNIVKLYEVLATKTKIYFVMEFVKGGELFAKVAKGRFSEDLSRKYFQQLISAVGYCHARGVFHRDLKPENLLLDENGNLKVTDFGLSAVKDQVWDDGLLHTLCGTPAYVAPEILIKRGYDGAKVDVWSSGVVLFVLTAGYLPFNDPNLMAMYKKIYKGEYKCPRSMSWELKRFLFRLLDTNPETRITIDEILEDPWFKKGLKREIRFYEEEEEEEKEKEDEGLDSVKSLNAFDLISMSSGLDLSGLFDVEGKPREDWERFVSQETPEKLVEKVGEIAIAQGLEMKRRKGWGVEVEGRNGKIVIDVEAYRLTDQLVVVEVRRKSGDLERYQEMWRGKIKPELFGSTSGEATQLAGD